jgi:site-specific DNA recombinase
LIVFSPNARVAAYLRDSGHEDQELSVEQQEQAIRTWCEQNGVLLTAIYRDAARPGSSVVGRAAFQEMIRAFRAPNCPETGVILWKFSRFARDIDDAQFYKADLRRRGIVIHSLNDSVPDGLDGRLFEAAIDWMNARFLEDLKADVKRGQRHLITQHGALGGLPPRGFLRVPVEIGAHRDGRPHVVHRWQPDPALVPLVRQAFELRAAGASYKAINAVTHFYKSTNCYERFFANELYIGRLRFADQVIDDYCPPIVDPATWTAVQAVQDAQRARVAPGPDRLDHPRRGTGDFLLTGLVHCARCGAMLTAETVQFKQTANYRYQYYTCSGRTRNTGCDARNVPRPLLENSVLDAVIEEGLSDQVIAVGWATVNSERANETTARKHRRDSAARDLATTRRRLANVADLLSDAGRSAPPALLAKLKDLQAEETRLQAALVALEKPARPHPPLDEMKRRAARLRQILSSGETDQIKPILQGLIKQITVEIDAQNKTLLGLVECYTTLPEEGFYAYGQCPEREHDHTHKIYF